MAKLQKEREGGDDSKPASFQKNPLCYIQHVIFSPASVGRIGRHQWKPAVVIHQFSFTHGNHSFLHENTVAPPENTWTLKPPAQGYMFEDVHISAISLTTLRQHIFHNSPFFHCKDFHPSKRNVSYSNIILLWTIFRWMLTTLSTRQKWKTLVLCFAPIIAC